MTFTGISPYLYYEDAEAALDWLERVLGFGPRRTHGADGRVEEAEIAVGDLKVMMTGHAPGPNEGGGALLIIHVDDVDAQYARVRDALADSDAGGVEASEPRDEAYGPRTFSVTDPWGYRWYFWQGDANY